MRDLLLLKRNMQGSTESSAQAESQDLRVTDLSTVMERVP
jgi:hypothetical protein